MRPAISVIICAHNPRPDYLGRVLEALEAQTLAKDQWELLLIDNASKEPLARAWDLSWHPQARIILEKELGLGPARLRGIQEALGALFVLVDDDNLLAPDYLDCAREVGTEFPTLGAWGANIKGEFEIAPPDSIRPYLDGLAVKEICRDYWTNIRGWSLAAPYGAGMCVRRDVAQEYARRVSQDPLRKSLGRTGTLLLSGEDGDLAWCSIELGLGTGRFKKLRLTHLIGKSRLTEHYMVRLTEGFSYSGVLLDYFWEKRPPTRCSFLRGIWDTLNALRAPTGFQRRINMARLRAAARARHMLRLALAEKS